RWRCGCHRRRAPSRPCPAARPPRRRRQMERLRRGGGRRAGRAPPRAGRVDMPVNLGARREPSVSLNPRADPTSSPSVATTFRSHAAVAPFFLCAAYPGARTARRRAWHVAHFVVGPAQPINPGLSLIRVCNAFCFGVRWQATLECGSAAALECGGLPPLWGGRGTAVRFRFYRPPLPPPNRRKLPPPQTPKTPPPPTPS